MKMVKYKHILTVVCAMAALGTSTVYAADTTITDSDLVMDEMIGSAGEQVLPDCGNRNGRTAQKAEKKESRT